MPLSEETKRLLAKPIGRIPSGIYILTTMHKSQNHAILASWVQQAGFEPPCVSVALAKGRPITESIRSGGRFCLSILPEGDTALMKKFARGISPGDDPFDGVATVVTPNGLRALGDALAYLDCELLTHCDFGADHELVVGEIVAGEVLKDGGPYIHVRGSGFRY